jgi:hypothetical protein
MDPEKLKVLKETILETQRRESDKTAHFAKLGKAFARGGSAILSPTGRGRNNMLSPSGRGAYNR